MQLLLVGWYFTIRDCPFYIAYSIDFLSKNRKILKTMGTKARENVINKWSIEVQGKHWLKMLDELK